MREECDTKTIYYKLLGIVRENKYAKCPICGKYIYDSSNSTFVNQHLPFVEDSGGVITAGIICGNATIEVETFDLFFPRRRVKNIEKLVLISCTKTTHGSGTVVYK